LSERVTGIAFFVSLLKIRGERGNQISSMMAG
jgi:hypothetical protein